VLVAHEKLVTAVARIDARGIGLVTVAQHDAVKTATHHHGDGIGGAVTHTTIHHPVSIGVDQPGVDIRTIDHKVRLHQKRRLYC